MSSDVFASEIGRAYQEKPEIALLDRLFDLVVPSASQLDVPVLPADKADPLGGSEEVFQALQKLVFERAVPAAERHKIVHRSAVGGGIGRWRGHVGRCSRCGATSVKVSQILRQNGTKIATIPCDAAPSRNRERSAGGRETCSLHNRCSPGNFPAWGAANSLLCRRKARISPRK